MERSSTLVVATFFSLVALACGGVTPTAVTPADDTPQKRSPSRMEIRSEMGVLDIKEVDSVFDHIKPKLLACLDQGNSFAAGPVVYKVRIGQDGKAKWAYLPESSIGDRKIEKCMLGVLMSAEWPRPQAGEDGQAEKPFEFPDREDRPPVDWTADRVAGAVQDAKSKFASCRNGNSGQFRATAIIQTDGTVLAAGMSAPDEKGEGIVDCLTDVVRGLKLPQTGSWPARVSFEIP